ncbi:hypothetical protein GQ600_11553 [Phytophthora cactorum]|nr:hypothetical protein GQ600_11553 [Phytophthora cactorum]
MFAWCMRASHLQAAHMAEVSENTVSNGTRRVILEGKTNRRDRQNKVEEESEYGRGKHNKEF